MDKVYYYEDELKDDFSNHKLPERQILDNYKYFSSNLFWRIRHFFWNRIIAPPISFCYAKMKFHWQVVNRSAFKRAKDTGYFIYGNHTQEFYDGCMTKIYSPKDTYIIVNPDNLNVKGLGWLIRRMGAMPLPGDIATTKQFTMAIDTLIAKKKAILIYPEAHIWPYYTKIRPFTAKSFRYPAKLNVPAFCFTTTYQARKWSKTPKITTYIDGPFYPDMTLPIKEREQKLRDEIFTAMQERSKHSNVEIIRYIKREKTDD